MNEDLDLVKILKGCPKGTKLYSLIWGECKLDSINYNDESYPIKLKLDSESLIDVTKDGRHNIKHNGECTLFPSRTQRNWAEFKTKKPKFDPKTLQPFDKVLAKSDYFNNWRCDLFSHISTKGCFRFICAGHGYHYCIPYNDDTKHLVGTTEEAPEYYRYWED